MPPGRAAIRLNTIHALHSSECQQAWENNIKALGEKSLIGNVLRRAPENGGVFLNTIVAVYSFGQRYCCSLSCLIDRQCVCSGFSNGAIGC